MTTELRFVFVLMIWAGLLLPRASRAQSDSISLAPLEVKGRSTENFMSGLKLIKIDSASLGLFRFQTMGELLAMYTPMAFKNYGPGQLNTVSFRGTSASHTAVMWNGLNINSPTLGQTDFSTIPVAAFDLLTVQFGSSASVIGSDAVGGGILLDSRVPFDGLMAMAGRNQASFGNYQDQFVARYGGKSRGGSLFSGKTAVYNGQMPNRYPYQQRNGYSVLPSETVLRGIVQDLLWRMKNQHELTANIWLTNNELVLAPENPSGREVTKTAAARAMVSYKMNKALIRTAWVRDVIDYAKGDFDNVDHASTDKYATRVERDFEWNFKQHPGQISVKTGAEWTLFQTRVEGYVQPKITENRTDLFVLTRYDANALSVSLNLRQALIRAFNPPLTPSLGIDYRLVDKGFYTVKIKGSLARSYRLPTLNERYWKNLGNPDIRPEDGFNKELGIEQKWARGAQQSGSFSVTAFHNRIKNWTYWNPALNYRVENLQQVLARGIEADARWERSQNDWTYGAGLLYALTKSTQEKAYDAYSKDIIGKQLVFVPLHTFNARAFAQYRNTRLTAFTQTISRRFSTFDNSQALPGYTLVHLIAETTFKWNKVGLRAQGQVNNLANTFYLNVRNNAMPGRNFAVNLIVSYNQPNKSSKATF